MGVQSIREEVRDEHPHPDPLDRALADREGEAFWFFGGLYTLKATGADTGGGMTAFEVLGGPEAAPPLHVHEREDEAFYVLEGEIELHVGDLVTRLGPGGFALAPRRVPHTWAVTSDVPARHYTVATPAGFDDFVRAVGEPAPALTLPPVPEAPPDLSAAIAAAAEAGVTILGPPIQPA